LCFEERNIALKKVLTLPFDHDNFIVAVHDAAFSDGPYYQPLFDSTRRFPVLQRIKVTCPESGVCMVLRVEAKQHPED